MAFSETLEKKIQKTGLVQDFDQRKMFGGLGYFINGNIALGIFKDYLIIRPGVEASQKLLKLNYTEPFNITRKTMKGWAMIHQDHLKSSKRLKSLIHKSLEFASILPKKGL